MSSKNRKPIGYVRATVEFPLYEGDKTDRENGWNDFIYEEPGIKDGELAVCRRQCKTLESSIFWVKE